MNTVQFAFAVISALAGVLGAAWIVSQSIARNRTATEQFQNQMVEALVKNVQLVGANKRIPEYDSRFAEGERRMDNINRQIESLQASNLSTQTSLAVLTHSMNNMKQRFEAFDLKLDEMPERIVALLQIRDRKSHG